MVATRVFTAEDLAAMGSDAPYELVDGELRKVSPCFVDSSLVAARCLTGLMTHVDAHDLGFVTGADGGFRLSREGERDTVVAPDVGFVRAECIPLGYNFKSFFPGAPDLAVEVNSMSDEPAEVAEKVARYLAAGTTLVWEVQPMLKVVVVHRKGRAPMRLGEGDVLDGEDVLPGFRLPVELIFREPVRRSSR